MYILLEIKKEDIDKILVSSDENDIIRLKNIRGKEYVYTTLKKLYPNDTLNMEENSSILNKNSVKEVINLYEALTAGLSKRTKHGKNRDYSKTIRS